VGLRVTIPCGHGAQIVKAAFAEVDGRYCAEVTYIPETGSSVRTEMFCEGTFGPVSDGAYRDRTGDLRLAPVAVLEGSHRLVSADRSSAGSRRITRAD
jgi:hypothetical protein